MRRGIGRRCSRPFELSHVKVVLLRLCVAQRKHSVPHKSLEFNDCVRAPWNTSERVVAVCNDEDVRTASTSGNLRHPKGELLSARRGAIGFDNRAGDHTETVTAGIGHPSLRTLPIEVALRGSNARQWCRRFWIRARVVRQCCATNQQQRQSHVSHGMFLQHEKTTDRLQLTPAHSLSQAQLPWDYY